MKSNYIVPGMIFSLVDRKPVSITAQGTLPMHFYLVISAGSEACLQDIQCMTISSMRNKDITYELPVVVNDTVSYVVPYNIVSFRRDDVQIQYYRGFLSGNDKLLSTQDFLSLCRDIYTDALYGDIDKSVKERISSYQKTFNDVYKDVPRYLGCSDNKFANSTVVPKVVTETIPDYNVSSVTVAPNFDSMLKRIDGLPHQYTQWSNDDIFSTLLFISENDLMSIVAKSNRYRSKGTLDNVKRTLRKIIKAMSSPVYTTLINGHEYKINFVTCKCLSSVVAADGHEVSILLDKIKKAMR